MRGFVLTALCLQGLFCFVVAAVPEQGTQGPEESFLRYNVTERRLYFCCPPSQVEKLISVNLYRGPSKKNSIALWNLRDQGSTSNERVTLLPSTANCPGLWASLSHVTCSDSATYTCSLLTVDDLTSTSEYFAYTGEPTVPVLTVYPRQARYRENDVIMLTCDARIGTSSNVIDWETRLPGEDFVLVNSDNVTFSTEQQATWDVHSRTTLTHTLTATDDNREWRCKLRETQHEAVFVVAVQCSDTDGRSGPCRPPQTTTVSREAVDVVTDKKTSSHTLLILVGVIAGLFTTMVISVAVMTMLLRKQHRKQLSITPSSSYNNSYGPSHSPYYPYSTRSLPAPPGTGTLRPASFPNSAYSSLGPSERPSDDLDDDETPPKVIRPYHQSHFSQPPSSSVYISMSAIPPLEEEVGGGGPAPTGQREALSRGRRPGSDTRSGRSVYSNEEVLPARCGRGTGPTRSGTHSGSSASHEACCTMGNLKEWNAQQ